MRSKRTIKAKVRPRISVGFNEEVYFVENPVSRVIQEQEFCSYNRWVRIHVWSGIDLKQVSWDHWDQQENTGEWIDLGPWWYEKENQQQTVFWIELTEKRLDFEDFSRSGILCQSNFKATWVRDFTG